MYFHSLNALQETRYTLRYCICILLVMLKRAIQHVADDSSFHISVEPAITALQQANAMLEWVCKKEFKDEILEFILSKLK